MKLSLFLAIFVLGLSLGSCGSKTTAAAPAVVGSCLIAGAACSDYIGSSYTAASIQAACTSGDYSASACSTTGVVGTCSLVTTGGVADYKIHYLIEAAAAQASCEAMTGASGVTATWTAALSVEDE